MKQLILFVTLIIGSFASQAQSVATLRDATAAVTDSVRIVPKFNVGDTRTYLVTNSTCLEGNYKDSTSVEYRFTVESVDDNHYAIYFIANNMKYEMPKGIPEAETRMILDFFCDKGFRFFINRHDLTVDSVSGADLKEPLREYLSKFFGTMMAQETDPTELKQALDEQLTDYFLTERAKELLRAMAATFTDQYGRTYALGGSRWIENYDETDEDVESYIVQDIDDEMDDDDIDLDDDLTDDEDEDDEEMPDFSVQRIHQAFAHINEDGSFFYREQISWDDQMLDDWYEKSEATFDSKGWPTEISSVVNMGETSVSAHWQLISN